MAESPLTQIDEMVLFGNERPLVRFGFVMTLFFRGGGTKGVRLKLCNLLREYYDLFGKNISHALLPGATKSVIVKDEDFISEYQAAAQSAEAYTEGLDYAVFGFHEGECLGCPPIFAFSAIASPPSALYPADVSHLDVYIPVSFCENLKWDVIVQFVTKWCDCLKPLHGTAGLGTFFDLGSLPQKAGLLSFPILKRFPGFDFNNSITWKVASCHSAKLCLRTTNWLTVLSNEYVNALKDGMTTVPDPVLFEGGVLIRSGGAPILGDSNRGLKCDSYRAISIATSRLRFSAFERHLPLFAFVPDPLDNLDETHKWLRRFDN